MRKSISIILLLVIASQSLLAQSAGGIVYGSNKAAGHYLNTRGFKMYYEVYGSGKPLLFIHGNGGSMAAFSNNIPYFAKKYKVIAVDSRAHGKSVDPSDSLTFEQMADDFNALLDSLHEDSAYVIGWSDGGINGLLLAIRHPDKVKKLAITGANLTPDTLGLIPSCYYGIVQTSADLRRKEQTPKVKNDLKINDLDLYQPHITPEQLHTIQCPSLVIGGDHDLIPVPHTVLIGQSIPNSYIWIIPESGHPTPIDKKEQFNKIVGDFFAQPFRKM